VDRNLGSNSPYVIYMSAIVGLPMGSDAELDSRGKFFTSGMFRGGCQGTSLGAFSGMGNFSLGRMS